MFENCGLTPGPRLSANNPRFRKHLGADANADTIERELDQAIEYVA